MPTPDKARATAGYRRLRMARIINRFHQRGTAMGWRAVITLTLLAALLLGGCGRKGPLYLPDEPAPAPAETETEGN